MITIPLLIKIRDIIVNPLIGLLFVISLAFFLWGVLDYIRGASSADERSTGNQHIIWGLVGMFIILSVVGIMNVICVTLECR